MRGGKADWAFSLCALAVGVSFWKARPTSPGSVSIPIQFTALLAFFLAWVFIPFLSHPPIDVHLAGVAKILIGVAFAFVASGASERSCRRFGTLIFALALVEATILIVRLPWYGREGAWLSGNPIYAGLLIAGGALYAGWCACDAEKSVIERRLFGSACVVLAITLVAAVRSQSSVVGLLAGFATLPGKERQRLYLASALVALFVFLVLPNRALLYTWHDWAGRLQIWTTSFHAMAERPVTGFGLGNFEAAYLRHAQPAEGILRYAKMTSFAHNGFLQIAVEAGIPAALALATGAVLLVRSTLKLPNPTLVDRWCGSVIALYLAASLFSFTVYLPINALLVAFCAGRLARARSAESAVSLNSLISYLGPALGVAVVYLGLYAADEAYSRKHALTAADLMPFSGSRWYDAAISELDGLATSVNPRQTAERAVRFLERSLEWSPGNAFVWSRLARVRAQFFPEPPGPVESAFQRAIELAPAHAPFFVQAGFDRLRRGDVANARRFFVRAVQLEPQAPVPRYGLALVALNEGNSASARALLILAAKLKKEYGRLSVESEYAAFLFNVDMDAIAHLLASGAKT